MKTQTNPQGLGLCPQTLGAHLHNGIGAEGDPHFVLTDCREPEGNIALQL